MSITHHPALRLELDVTPRWWGPSPALFDDAADVTRAIGSSGGGLVGLLVDLSIGVTGVRMVVAVPAGPSTNLFEAERVGLVALLDGLDASNPRRARVTAARAAEQAKRIAAAKAAEDEARAKEEAAALAEAALAARQAARQAEELAVSAEASAAAALPNGAPAAQPSASN